MFVKFSCEWIDFGAKLLNEALPHLCVRLLKQLLRRNQVDINFLVEGRDEQGV